MPTPRRTTSAFSFYLADRRSPPSKSSAIGRSPADFAPNVHSLASAVDATISPGGKGKRYTLGATTIGRDSEEGWEDPNFPSELKENYVVKEHIQSIVDAMDPKNDHGVERIVAASQVRPLRISNEPKKRRDSENENESSDQGFNHWMRMPFFTIGMALCAMEFVLYVMVRWLVRIAERLSALASSHSILRLSLKHAQSYHAWVASAIDLDDQLGYDSWKRKSTNPYYDAVLVRKVVDNLREMRETNDFEGIRTILEVCLRSNFAGIESWRIYSSTHYGTKDLVEEYVDEVELSIAFLRSAAEEAFPLEEKAKFFKYATKNFGSTVLALSGGASMGWYHFGVVKAFLDFGLVPRIVSGTSAGSIVAAALCCRTDEECLKILVPQLATIIKSMSEPVSVWLPRMWETGNRFAVRTWAENISWITRGSTTFKEAYERTGRVLNISVIPADPHSPTKVLNYITAPNCVIWSACIASAAVPGFIPPAVLMQKNKDGTVTPWEFAGKHKDGSIRADVPSKALHMLFNTTYTIVSQVNPHIHLFLFSGAGSPGEPIPHKPGSHAWRGGFFLSAAERFLKLELIKNMRLMKDLELTPHFMSTNWSSMFLQKFDGQVTILPKTRFIDFLHAVTDPSVKDMEWMLLSGQQASWPKLHMVDNRLRIEKQIEIGLEEVREELYKLQPHPEAANIPEIHINPTSPPSSQSPPPSDENKKHSLTTKQSSSERHKKRRETLAKLGLTSGFGLGVTGEHGQVGNFASPRMSDPEKPRDYVKSFMDGQEKILRRLSRVGPVDTRLWDESEADGPDPEDGDEADDFKDVEEDMLPTISA